LDRGMKPVLLSLALALLMVGCGEEETEFEMTKRLAEGGNKIAQFNLGAMYGDGMGGVPEDDKKAVKWYTKSAEQGDADAQFMLGLIYRDGEGVPKDLVHAYAWFNVLANEFKKAKEWRDEIELNAKELAEAKALSSEIYKRIEANYKRIEANKKD